MHSTLSSSKAEYVYSSVVVLDSHLAAVLLCFGENERNAAGFVQTRTPASPALNADAVHNVGFCTAVLVVLYPFYLVVVAAVVTACGRYLGAGSQWLVLAFFLS